MDEPPIPAHVDLRDFRFMPLDVRRLLTSETWIEAASDPRLGHALISLWSECWHQVPCGSLPDNDQILYRLSMCPDLNEWKRIKNRALRGFVKCSDGKLYHPVVVEKAIEAWERRNNFLQKTDSKITRQQRWRDHIKKMSEELRTLGQMPPAGAKATTLRRLLVDARASTRDAYETPTKRLHETQERRPRDAYKASTGDAREMPLTGTGTGTGIKNPSREKASRGAEKSKPAQPDPRHKPIVECLQRHYGQINQGVKMPWSGLGANRLASLLSRNPSRPAEDFILCVEHRFASEVNPSESPEGWVPRLLDYFGGPLDRYGKPVEKVTRVGLAKPSLKTTEPKVEIGDPLSDETMKSIQELIGPRTAQTWFRPLRALQQDGHTVLIAPNELFVIWISEHYRTAINDLFGSGVEVRSEESVASC